MLRLEGYERQQKEITQLQAEIAKLQQRCRAVSCTVEAPSPFKAPWDPSHLPLLCLL